MVSHNEILLISLEEIRAVSIDALAGLNISRNSFGKITFLP
jgi:hypothetical protein